MDDDRFHIRITVEPSDIDEQDHVNNIVYLRWVQEVAIAHWRAAAPAAAQESLFWVVVRHEIDYKRPAYLGDEILAFTWVGNATRRTFERHTELVRAADRRVLARALTLWCPMDVKTGKPTDVTDEVRFLFSTPGPTDQQSRA